MGIGQFFNWVGEQVTSAVTGVVEGFQQIFSGNIIEGFLNVITFGAYGNLKDWIDNLQPETPEATYKDRKRTTSAATTPRQVIYGRVRTGGQLVYIGSTGDDSRYLHMIIAFAPHEVESIDQIYFNDELVTQGTNPLSKYSDNLDVIIKNGDQTSADSTIVSRISEWTSNHKLLGIAYVYVRLEYDDEIFSSGVPNVTALIRGKNDIYDPRTGTSGYTNNHALCLANYLQSDLGVRATDDEIDWDSFDAAADVSDELFAGKRRREVSDFNDSIFPWNWTWEIVETEARYSVDGMVSTAASIVDNLNSLAHAGAATLVYTQGVWSITAGSYTAPDASHYFDESDLVGGIQFSPGPGKSNLINTAKGTYIDPSQDYEPVSFPEISPSAYVTQDGEELAVDIPMPFAQSPTMARRLGKIAIERERFGVSAEVTLKYTAAGVRVGDRIGLSITRLGWTNKIFMVENLNFSLGGGIGLSLREDAQDVWDWDAGEALEVVPPPATNIPEREAIAAPTGLVIDQTVNEPLRAYGNETTIRFSATAPADSRFAYIKFQYRLEGDLQWIDIRYDVADSASITVFADGRDYELSAQSVSIQGVVSNARLTDKFTVALIKRTQQDNLPAAVTVPPVRGLRISNNIDNDDGWNQWKGPDVIFKWNETSQTAAGNIIDVNGVTDLHLKGYKVQIVNNLSGEVLREALLQTPEFTYTLTMNRRDTNNNPIRSGIKCVVTAATTTGYQSAAKSIVVSNPPPPALEALSVIPGFNVIEISYLRPSDLDFAGVDIWVSQTQGFDPDATDPTATVSDNSYVASGLTQGETYYVRLRPFDLFGKTGTNTSAEFAVTTKTGTDITGLSGWAYEIDPVDRTFIEDNLEDDAVPSEKIVNLTVAKLTTGTLNATETITSEGVIRAVDDVASPVVQAGIGPATFGTATTYLMWAYNGTDRTFSVDELGNATFSGELSAATGTFGDVASGQYIEFSGSVLEFGDNATIGDNTDRTVTVGSGGDYSTINDALEALSRVVPAYKSGGFTATVELLSGYVFEEPIDIAGIDLSWITITSASDEIVSIDGTLVGVDSVPFFKVSQGGSSPLLNIRIDTINDPGGFLEPMFTAQVGGKIRFKYRSAGTLSLEYLSNGIALDAFDNAEISFRNGKISTCSNAFTAFNNSRIDASSTDASDCSIVASASDNSAITCSDSTFTNVSSTCLLAISNSSISADNTDLAGTKPSTGITSGQSSRISASFSDYSGCSSFGIVCLDAATINARSTNARKGGSNSTSDITVSRGGIISADSATGGTSVTTNTITADGIIFK